MKRSFIQEGQFKGRVFSKNNGFRRIGLRISVTGAMVSLFILAASISFDADALGVGTAESDSFIGEQLSIRIPLFNVTDPNSLSVSFESKQFDGDGQAKVNAVLDRTNSQLSIMLSSDSVVNEPYVSFKLDLVDNNTELSKEFTVLMDLPAQRNTGIISPLEQTVLTTTSQSVFNNQVASDVRTSGSVLGPRDTAEAGRIPEKFGAVLDGQSLWRVARRINEAMGVSKSQMIWGLYQANPGAFSSRSVASLKAGSFLTIPDEAIVRGVSNSQAKANLAALRSNQQPISDATVPKGNDEIQEFIADERTPPLNQEQTPPFQVTGIDKVGGEVANLTDGQSQQVIVSLTETVGNLSQQLIRKDQKIEFLEKQVGELKSFISDGSLAEFTEFTELPVVGSNLSALEPSLETTLVQESTPVLEVPPSAVDTVVPVIASRSEPANSSASAVSSIPLWQWVLLGIFSLALLAYILRGRFYALFESLNLFGSNNEVEFTSVAVEGFGPHRNETQAEPVLEIPSYVVEEKIKKDYSVMSAVERSESDNDVLDGISYLDLADDGSYEENDVLEFETEEETEEAEDLSFDERFERLLAERDFGFARELLEFARHNEINDERYHCERLRILEKMRDEDGFYDYYYDIESKIQTFPQNLQTQISQLVVQLAQH